MISCGIKVNTTYSLKISKNDLFVAINGNRLDGNQFITQAIKKGAKVILCDPHRATVIGHDFKSQLKATKMTS